jgi:hypothetical protein
MTKLIDRLPLLQIAFMALLLGLAPFSPEPHLVEKVRWLFNGSSFKLIDWGDLVLHGGPVIVLIWNLVRLVQLRS